jgi:hypothetical protein
MHSYCINMHCFCCPSSGASTLYCVRVSMWTFCCCGVQGDLVFKVISYTPWPVADDFEGERVRIPVGPIKDKRPRCGPFNQQIEQPHMRVVFCRFLACRVCFPLLSSGVLWVMVILVVTGDILPAVSVWMPQATSSLASPARGPPTPPPGRLCSPRCCPNPAR